MCVRYSRDVALFKEVDDVVSVYASSDACCEDNECYIPSTSSSVYTKVWYFGFFPLGGGVGSRS